MTCQVILAVVSLFIHLMSLLVSIANKLTSLQKPQYVSHTLVLFVIIAINVHIY